MIEKDRAMVMPRKAVLVKDLLVEKDKKTVLNRISFSMNRDERIVVCGPSGAGKSTLLRALNGLDPMASGMVRIFGAQLTQEADSIQAVRAKTGMLFQAYHLFPHLTILENCLLPLRSVKGFTIDKAVEMTEYYLEKVKMLDYADRYPIALSGGQQQRAAIARVLCMEPELLLFDEPTSALDLEMTKDVLDVLNDLSVGGMTMIVVTHEMSFAKKFADRVLYIDGGEVVVDQSVGDFFSNQENERIASFLHLASRT